MSQSDEQWIAEYENKAKNQDQWLIKAKSLIYAAEKLKAERCSDKLSILHQISTCMMLYSFAIENMIKCIIIHDDPCAVNNGKLNNNITTHKLKKLFNDAGISYTKSDRESEKYDPKKDFSEEYFLKRLTDFAVAWGRYPIPKKWDKYKEALTVVVNEKEVMLPFVFHQRDLDTIQKIITKIEEKLSSKGISKSD